MNKILEATKYLNKGIATIPIKPNSKVAAIPWKKYQGELPTKNDIIRWFDSDCNMAVICSNGLVVLDFDNLEAYREWRLKYQKINTYQVRTKRGYHLYFKVKNPVKTKIKAIGGVDIKANGGYVLVPPSVIEKCKYEIMNNTNIMQIENLSEVIKYPKAIGIPICVGVPSLGSARKKRVPSLKCYLYRGVCGDIKSHLSVLDLASRYTDMKQSGYDAYIGRCPHYTHPDKNPSFRVLSNRASCFKPSCILHDDRAMDVIELYGRMHDLEGRDAISALAKELGLIQ